MKKSPVIYNDKCFYHFPFLSHSKFYVNTICVLAIDPFLTLRVVFRRTATLLLCVRCVKANVYLAILQQLEVRVWSEMEWQQ